jgi:hypothetical protein
MQKFTSIVVTLCLLHVSASKAGIFISTNGYAYFPPTVQSELQLTGVLAADGGSDFIIELEPNGVVSNFFSNPEPIYPPSGLSNVTAISVSGYAALALTSNGTVAGWGFSYGSPTPPLPPAAQVPAGLSNVIAISAGGESSLALLHNGTVVSWGDNASVPAGLSDVVAIDAGLGNLALKADGTVVSWGEAYFPPVGLTNVIAISCGRYGNLALRADGTLIGWSASGVQTNLVSANVTNTVAISGDPDAFMALQADGAVVTGGTPPLLSFAEALSNVVSIGRIELGTAVVVEGDGLASFPLQPRNQIVGQGGTIYLHARAVGPQPLSCQWQLNGTDLPGATNGDLIITNATRANAGNYQAVVSFNLHGTPYWAGSALAAITVQPPPQVPILLTAPVLQPDGSFTLSANKPGGGSFPLTNSSLFVLQASSNLLNWTSLTNNMTLTNGAITFRDPAAISAPAGFYRLLGQP